MSLLDSVSPPAASPLAGCDAPGGGRPVPVDLSQRPGLKALAYRVGNHRLFNQAMLAGLVGDTPLGELGTRRLDDFTIGLIDSWAAVLDVLTFYQERIANEFYLGTAAEARSLFELARAIGYEARPGVAASVSLAFEIEPTASAPEGVIVPAGTRAQSLPGPGQLPQSFETGLDLLARPEWNRLTPRRWQKQWIDATTRKVWVKGTAPKLGPGDPMLLVVDGDPTPLEVVRVQPDFESDRTLVEMADFVLEPGDGGDGGASGASGGKLNLRGGAAPSRAAGLSPEDLRQLVPEAVSIPGETGRERALPDLRELTGEVKGAAKRRAEMIARLGQGGFSRRQMLDALRGLRQTPRPVADPVARRDDDSLGGGRLAGIAGDAKAAGARAAAAGDGETALYALRVRTSPFGHNAPGWSTLPDEWRGENIYPSSWDYGWPVTSSAYGGSQLTHCIRLAQPFPQIQTGSWLVLRSAVKVRSLGVNQVREVSVVDFGLSGRVSQLTLTDADGNPLTTSGYEELGSEFRLRDTTVYTASEALPLAEVLVETVPAGLVELEVEEAVPDLEAGRALLLAGEPIDLPGVTAHEELELADAVQIGGYTRLVLTSPLASSYRRASVTLHANVVAASHGERREEVLGSGDAGQSFQRFPLRQAPLTFTSAPVASGAESSLEIRVGGVRWREARDFYGLGPDDRAYVLRHHRTRNPDGSEGPVRTEVLFGDGVHGARLPSGNENVTAVYRSGIGRDGLVEAGSIQLLATRPLGVRSVANPLAPAGAEDPESADKVRQNAPLAVTALERVVSLQDFEDFARAFAGIGKAQARWVWDGGQRLVHLTVAGAGGAELSETVHRNLLAALEGARASRLPVRVAAHQGLFFTVEAAVRRHPDYRWQDVARAVRLALIEAFSFDARGFAQRVAVSEVLTVIQGVAGVVSVTLDQLDYAGDAGGNEADAQGLPARGARQDVETGAVLPAQLLLLLPDLIQLREAD